MAAWTEKDIILRLKAIGAPKVPTSLLDWRPPTLSRILTDVRQRERENNFEVIAYMDLGAGSIIQVSYNIWEPS